MTDSIKVIEKIILYSEGDQKLKMAEHAMSGLVKGYSEILKVTDLEKRIQALEQKLWAWT